MGQREGFSAGDIAKLNAMYHCDSKIGNLLDDELPAEVYENNNEINADREPFGQILPFLPIRPFAPENAAAFAPNRPVMNLLGNVMRPFQPDRENSQTTPNRPIMNLVGNVMRPFRPDGGLNNGPNRPIMNLLGNIMRPFRPRGDEDETDTENVDTKNETISHDEMMTDEDVTDKENTISGNELNAPSLLPIQPVMNLLGNVMRPFRPASTENSPNAPNRPLMNLVGNVMRPFRPASTENSPNAPNRPLMNLIGNVMRPFRPQDPNNRPNRPMMNLLGNIMRPFRPQGEENEDESTNDDNSIEKITETNEI